MPNYHLIAQSLQIQLCKTSIIYILWTGTFSAAVYCCLNHLDYVHSLKTTWLFVGTVLVLCCSKILSWPMWGFLSLLLLWLLLLFIWLIMTYSASLLQCYWNLCYANGGLATAGLPWQVLQQLCWCVRDRIDLAVARTTRPSGHAPLCQGSVDTTLPSC